jgi:hypothetical protein
MVDMFNIWNPHLTSSATMVFDLTRAEGESIHHGTSSFISACLNAFSFSAQSVSWTIKIARQSYYSEYLDSVDWMSRWDIVWIIELAFPSPIELVNINKLMPYSIDELDASNKEQEDCDLSPSHALLLASFPKSENINLIVENVSKRWKEETGFNGDLELKYFPHVKDRILARCLIDCVKFPEDIDSLDLLYKQLKQIGGLTNWQDVMFATID